MEVPNLHKTKVYMMFATRDFSFIDINSQFFFENGPMPTPTKLQNPTNVGSRDPNSAQWSHPNKIFLGSTVQDGPKITKI